MLKYPFHLVIAFIKVDHDNFLLTFFLGCSVLRSEPIILERMNPGSACSWTSAAPQTHGRRPGFATIRLLARALTVLTNRAVMKLVAVGAALTLAIVFEQDTCA
jgi:hypothetical protein